MRRNRILFGLWIFILLLLFFCRGQAAVSMILLFSAVYAVAAYLLTRRSGKELTAGFTGGDMVNKGETMTVTMKLSNRGKLPVFCGTGEAEAANLLTGDSRRLPMSFSLPPGGNRKYTFDLTDQHCGKIELRLPELTICDPLRLFAVPARAEHAAGVPGAASADCYFAPEIQPVQIPEEFLDSYNMESYQYSQHEKGNDPGEVFGVREYQEGDSLKQIHWKLTAKLDEVIVKIPSFPIENNILVILDNLLDPQAQVQPEQRSAQVELLYSLSSALLGKSIPHSIGWYDTREQLFIRRQIRSEAELWASVPAVLGCGFADSDVSTVVRYGMNPITYDADNDQFYVPIMKGRVQCLNADTLRSKWISEEYRYSQTLSPISYIDGCVYTGIWETEVKDGPFFCLDAATGETKWKYVPSEHGDAPHGFYWAGCYVDENYAVVGSDDGADNTFSEAGAFPETAVAYSFNRRTGEVIDKITGVKGDIRSSVVYNHGHIYFVTKGGRLYKADFGADGTFSNVSYIQLQTPGKNSEEMVDVMMTSTPVVHNGRIYVGAAGAGGQFSADGGHMFAVIRDDGTLSSSSLIYTVPISGYPQASPVLSTATENTDGKVRLYFTFNAFPGGIYCLEDSADATADHHENAKLLYRPELPMQQYCISPLCCDREGTFYYKNDSGYLMAVSVNKAYLDGISVKYGSQELKWEYPFEPGILNYSLQAPNDADAVDVRLGVPDGMTARVNGEDYAGSKISVPVGEDESAIPVTVSKTVGEKTYTRTYTLNTATQSNNANLGGLVITASNTKPKQIADSGDWVSATKGIGYDPVFDPGIEDYVSKICTDDKGKAFLRLWLETADPEASVRVIPAQNVGNTQNDLNDNGTIKKRSGGYYPVYFVKGEIAAEVDAEVTAPSGKVTKTYHITLQRSEEYIETGEQPLRLTPSSAELHVKGRSRSTGISAEYAGSDVTGNCTFESSDPEVAAVDQNGLVTAVSCGDAEIWVNYAQETRRGRVHVDVTEPMLSPPLASLNQGYYTEPIRVALQASGAGAQVRYVIGDAEEDLEAPTTTGGVLYEEPISIGEAGQRVSVKIRAIACGSGYRKSYPEDFIYTVDLTGEPPSSPGVSLEPDSIYLAEADLETFRNLPNGTGYDAVTELLLPLQAHVKMNKAYTGESAEVTAGIAWDDADSYDYDPSDQGEQNFLIRGQVVLPEGVDDLGKNLDILLPVTVKAKPQPEPEKPKPAKPAKVTGLSATVNASAKTITLKYKSAARAGTYRVAYRKAGGAWKYLTAKGTTRKITGLAASGSYEVKVCAVNDGGQGAYSASCFCMISKTTLKLKPKKKAITVTMKKIKPASGYRLRYSLKKNLSSSKTVKTKKTTYTIKKLKKKKLYYVQATPYKVISGKTYWGQPVVKKVKTK